ncbi:hypothetical protein GXW82_23970 [Streptacidiphilus sp. 4-A2]|nr:hypothetical protein [Streptacidiphilus sp. 4-A2]
MDLVQGVRSKVAALRATVPERLRLPLAVAAITQAVWLVWWAALYPGLMSFDSITYVYETTTPGTGSPTTRSSTTPWCWSA